MQGNMFSRGEHSLIIDLFNWFGRIWKYDKDPIISQCFRLTSDAAQVLQEFYLELRRQHHNKDSTPITTRQLESLIRLTEARARCELREEATKEVIWRLLIFTARKWLWIRLLTLYFIMNRTLWMCEIWCERVWFVCSVTSWAIWISRGLRMGQGWPEIPLQKDSFQHCRWSLWDYNIQYTRTLRENIMASSSWLIRLKWPFFVSLDVWSNSLLLNCIWLNLNRRTRFEIIFNYEKILVNSQILHIYFTVNSI